MLTILGDLGACNMKKKLYKILVNMKSCHGGSMEWEVGKWYEYNETEDEPILICERGYHLTTKPYKWYKWGCQCFEADAEGIKEWDDDKCVCKKVRLIKEVPHPKWWLDVIKFVNSLKKNKWFENDGKPRQEWKLFETRDAAEDAAEDAARNAAWNAAWDAALNAARNAAEDAARNAAWNAAEDAAWDAAWDTAWNAAWDAAWDAARNAALMALGIVSDCNFEKKHANHIKARFNVWEKGYGLLCDVNGVLYVYKKP